MAPPNELYSRLALWLMTAEEHEIAAYWEHFVAQDDQPRPIIDLIMVGWTRVNAAGATAAVKGTEYEHFAWWAWTCHEPDLALKTALAEAPHRMGDVTWGLGEFHPKWVREHWDEIPENIRGGTLPGILKWAQLDDPMATAEFLKEQGRVPSVGMMRYLVRQDAQGAYDWFVANSEKMKGDDPFGGSTSVLRVVADALAKDAPEVLRDIIAKTPPGAERFALESAVFQELLKVDLGAAVAEARSEARSDVASAFLAKAGLQLLRSDPDMAHDLFDEIVRGDAQAFSARPSDGEGKDVASNEDSWRLLNELASADPARTLEGYLKYADGESEGAVVGAVGRIWGEEDVDSLRDWVKNREVGDAGNLTAQVSYALSRQDRHDEALDWVRERDLGSATMLHHLGEWYRVNPSDALTWVESADLSAEERQHVETRLGLGK
ncbi:hypothetical protein V2O64_04185 [Verrucomicrobiaceae bacterium 227]